MKLALSKMRGLGWIALVLIVLISLYPLSLSVATLRSDLARTEKQILQTKQKIRYLETEFAARANLQQLELWNRLDYGYIAPSADQYLGNERALANLDKGRDHLRDIVEVAMLDVGDAAGAIGSPFGDGIPLPQVEIPADQEALQSSSDDTADVTPSSLVEALPGVEQQPLPAAAQPLENVAASNQQDSTSDTKAIAEDSDGENVREGDVS